MTTQTLQFENRTMTLPRSAPRAWKDAKVSVRMTDDSIVIYKVGAPTLADLEPKLREIGKRITQKDIDAAVRAVRKERGR